MEKTSKIKKEKGLTNEKTHPAITADSVCAFDGR